MQQDLYFIIFHLIKLDSLKPSKPQLTVVSLLDRDHAGASTIGHLGKTDLRVMTTPEEGTPAVPPAAKAVGHHPLPAVGHAFNTASRTA